MLAPTASTEPDYPVLPYLWWERRRRQVITHGLLRQAQALCAQGKRVTVLTPGPRDLAAMGINLHRSPAQGGRTGTVSQYLGRCAPQGPDQVSPESSGSEESGIAFSAKLQGLDETVTPGDPAFDPGQQGPDGRDRPGNADRHERVARINPVRTSTSARSPQSVRKGWLPVGTFGTAVTQGPPTAGSAGSHRQCACTASGAGPCQAGLRMQGLASRSVTCRPHPGQGQVSGG